MQMRMFFAACATLLAAAQPTLAVAGPARPVVLSSGRIRQLPVTDTVTVNPSTTAGASINIPPGVAPTSPADGDCWTTASGLFCRISGVTVAMGAGAIDLSAYATTSAVTAGYQPLAAVLSGTTASFTTAKDTKLSGIATGATANSSDATLLARANHTGTQAASTISDFTASVDARLTGYATTAAVSATYQPLDADLTSIAALTTTAAGRALLDDADATAQRTTLGLGTLATQSGTLTDYALTTAVAAGYQPIDGDLTSIAGLAGTTGFAKKTSANTWTLDTSTYLTGNQSITLSGDVSGTGSTAITTAIGAGKVTLAMQANMATASVVYRKTAGAGAPEVQTLATLKTDLGLTGTNSGDQTTITGNAGTATALANSRTIGISGKATGTATSFNGTADITIPVTAVTLVAGDIPNIAESQVTNLTADLAAKQPLDTQLTDLAALAYTSNALRVLRVNSGATGWELATVSAGGGDVVAANNLSEYTASAATARSNIGAAATASPSFTGSLTLPIYTSGPWTIRDGNGANRMLFTNGSSTYFGSPGGGYYFRNSADVDITNIDNNGYWTINGVKIYDADLSHTMGIAVGSNLTAARTLTITTGDADRTLTLTGSASISGTNNGDQTSIVGITGTIAQFNTAVTDADLAPVANPVFSGVMAWQQGNTVSKSASGTLTGAEVLSGIIVTTGTAANAMTLPTGTLMDTAVTTQFGAALPNDRMFDWYTINTGTSAAAITMTAGTGHTIVGAAVCAIGATCHWGTRKTATNTFVTYRLG